MRLLLIGPPGSGKGTQAERIGAHFGIPHISSGEMLRQHVEGGTSIGRTVKDYLDRGDLAPDGLVMDILRKPVEAAAHRSGYILDGFPRTVAQAEAAYLIAREIGAWVQVALSLEVPRDQLISRMVDRGKVAGRTDDNLDVINRRLRLFDDVTPALLDYYDQREILIRVDGSKPIDEVSATIIAELEQVRPRLT